jgi:hypothetical protein
MAQPKKNENRFKPKRFNVQVDGSFLVGTGVLSMDEYYKDQSQPLWHRILIYILQMYTAPHNRNVDVMKRINFQNPHLVDKFYPDEVHNKPAAGQGTKGNKHDKKYQYKINACQKALQTIKQMNTADMYYVGIAGELIHHSELPNGGITQRRIVPKTKIAKELLRVIKHTNNYDQLPVRGRERRLANACPFKLEIDELIDSLIETEVADLNVKRKVYNRYAMALAKRYEKRSILNSPVVESAVMDSLLEAVGPLINAKTLQSDPPAVTIS